MLEHTHYNNIVDKTNSRIELPTQTPEIIQFYNHSTINPMHASSEPSSSMPVLCGYLGLMDWKLQIEMEQRRAARFVADHTWPRASVTEILTITMQLNAYHYNVTA